MVNFPRLSVKTVFEAALTVTPCKGVFVALSVTVPLIATCWACKYPVQSMNKAIRIFFIKQFLLRFIR
jgi:hypothetical protein